mgnify:FL=1
MRRTLPREAAPVSLPVTLTIAGSDSGGGAGLQADIQTLTAHETFPTSVVTGVTAQHTRGVERSTVLEPGVVAAQYDAIVDDFDVRAAKTGMLGTAEVVETARERVATADFPVVVDPVIVTTTGDRLLGERGVDAYEKLIPEAALLTPNHDEATVLTEVTVEGEVTAREAGKQLVEMGAEAALVTGGHGGDTVVRDVLVTAGGSRTFTHPRVETAATHGSGCTLSAAITANLASGAALESAVEDAIAFVARAVRYPHDVGGVAGPVHHLAGLRNDAARVSTAETVRDLVSSLRDLGIGPLVPEVGTNVVGATSYAETVAETAAVDGRLSRTTTGVEPTGGVRFGASSHLARFLLSVREYAPERRFATNCRVSDETRATLADLAVPVARFDRRDEPDEASTMNWAARHVFGDRDERPLVVVDDGAHGKEPMIRVVTETPDQLLAVVRALHPER